MVKTVRGWDCGGQLWDHGIMERTLLGVLENKSLTRYTYIQLKDIFPLAVVRFDYK